MARMLTMQFAGQFEAAATQEGASALRAFIGAMDDDYERRWSLEEGGGRIVLRPRTATEQGADECRAGGLWEQLAEICDVARRHGVILTGEMRWLREDYCDDASGALGGWVAMVDGHPRGRRLPLPRGADGAPWWNRHDARQALALPTPEGEPSPAELDARAAKRGGR